MALTLEIVTPEKTVYSETVDEVVLPTHNGETGILPGHIPLLTQLVAGELVVTQKGIQKSLAVDKGFAQVSGQKVSVLTEAAITLEAIDLGAIEQAEKSAQKALKKAEEQGLDPSEIERLETQLESTARFAIAQRLLKKSS